MNRKFMGILLSFILAVSLFAALPAPRALAANTCTWTGVTSTAWATASNWSTCGGVAPTSADSVSIPDVSGGSNRYPSITTAVAVVGITINSNASLTISTGGSLTLTGDLANNGTFTATGFATTFAGTSNQTIGGSGTTTFGTITVNNTGTSPNNVVEVTSSSFSASSGFLTLTKGILKMSGSFSFSNTFFSPAGYTIASGAGLWLNNSNVTVTGQLGSPTLNGSLRISAGTYNVGTSNNSMTWGNNSSFTMEGGAFNVAARLAPTSATSTNSITFAMSGGTLTVSMGTAATPNGSATIASFDIPASGTSSSFSMSGGTIVIQKAATAVDYRMSAAGTVNITGGTVQFGNSSTSGSPTLTVGAASGATNVFPNLSINASGTPTVKLNTAITVKGDLTIATGTTLNANSQNTAITGNWTNNGTFTAGTGTVTFSGSSAQGVSGSTTFNNLTINNASGVTLNGNVTVNGTLSQSGNLTVPSGKTLALGSTDVSYTSGTVTNSGTIQQTKSVSNATVTFAQFGTAHYGAEISTVNNLGSTIVAVSGNQTCSNTAGSPLNRCWSITPTTPASASVKFYFTNAEMQSGQTLSSLNVWHYNGATWDMVTKGAATSGTCDSGAVNCFVEGTGITSYSPFGLKNGNPLAAPLSSLDALAAAGRVTVRWETASEADTLGFNLYRAAAAGDWTKLNAALIPSQTPGSPFGASYRYDDASAARGMAYRYRLAAVGLDGAETPLAAVQVNVPYWVWLAGW